MAIVLTSMRNDTRSGEDKVAIGSGTVTTGGACLQGFYMSWGHKDHHVNVLNANTLAARISHENGMGYVSYGFRCEMRDDSGNVTSDNRLLSVVIANLVRPIG